MLRKLFTAFSFVAILLLASSIHAQTPTTGQVNGVVKDPSGGVVAGAHVTLTSEAGVNRETTTNADGRYTFSLVPPGVYRLRVDAKGFKSFIVDKLEVRITEYSVANADLALEGGSTSVTVTSELPMVDTESPSRGAVIPSTDIRQLPLATRNFQQLLTLTPGTSASISNSSDLGRGDTAFNVNGQRTLSNAVVINGVDANSIGTGSTPNLAVPATDTLQEFIVQTSFYDASQGRNAGSVVAAVTRSGTNDFHGNLYEFFRNDVLDANNFFLKDGDVPRPPYKRNQFGGTLGGPVIKDRIWFFGSYQGTREVNGTSLENSVGTVFVPGNLTNDRSDAALTALAAVLWRSYPDRSRGQVPAASNAAQRLVRHPLGAASDWISQSCPRPSSRNLAFHGRPIQYEPGFQTLRAEPALRKIFLRE